MAELPKCPLCGIEPVLVHSPKHQRFICGRCLHPELKAAGMDIPELPPRYDPQEHSSQHEIQHA